MTERTIDSEILTGDTVETCFGRGRVLGFEFFIDDGKRSEIIPITTNSKGRVAVELFPGNTWAFKDQTVAYFYRKELTKVMPL